MNLHPARHLIEIRLHALAARQLRQTRRRAALIHPYDHVGGGTTVAVDRNDRGVLARASNATDLAPVRQRGERLVGSIEDSLPNALCILLGAAVRGVNRLDRPATGAKQAAIARDDRGLDVRCTEIDGKNRQTTSGLLLDTVEP